MTEKEKKAAYQKAWRNRQTPEKQAEIRSSIRKWHQEHKDDIKLYKKIRYLESPLTTAIQVEKRLRKIKADPKLFEQWKEKRRLHKRAKIRGITEDQWVQLVSDSGFRCSYCGVTFSKTNKPEPDHVLSIRNGGSRTLDNIVPSCRSCNARKQNKPVEQFRRELEADFEK